MGSIHILNEDKRPRIICPYCKNEMIVDIRDFNRDISKLAIYTCNVCKGQIYGGVILLAAPRMETLLDNITKVIKAVNAPNTLTMSPDGSNSNEGPQGGS